ncbi:hypothetical protein AB0I81_17830 [Nonomuraea sp. NPDC050404]
MSVVTTTPPQVNQARAKGQGAGRGHGMSVVTTTTPQVNQARV